MAKFKVGYDVRDTHGLKNLSETFLGIPMSQVMWFCFAIIISSFLSHVYLAIIK
jgi:hypothetical protein